MATYEASTDPDRGGGWVAFAGVMILIAGALNVIYGFAAIDNSSFFVEGNRFVLFDDVNTWGWIHLIVGIVQVLAAFSIFQRHPFGRFIGILTAGLNLIVVLLWITALPVGGLILALIDILIIYGLVAYGGRPAEA
jgi:hypothetical protein